MLFGRCPSVARSGVGGVAAAAAPGAVGAAGSVGERLVVPGATVLSLVCRGGGSVPGVATGATPGVSCTFTRFVRLGAADAVGVVEVVAPPAEFCCCSCAAGLGGLAGLKPGLSTPGTCVPPSAVGT